MLARMFFYSTEFPVLPGLDQNHPNLMGWFMEAPTGLTKSNGTCIEFYMLVIDSEKRDIDLY